MPRPPTTRNDTLSVTALTEGLKIDEDALDQCLVEQADYYYQVAKLAIDAGGERDTLELQLKELKAELDADIRQQAIRNEEKLTETQLTNRITVLPRVKDLQRKCLEARRKADSLSVLKEGYQQRSYALRELNASQLARFYSLGTERGAAGARASVGDRIREQAEGIRRERYRPRNSGD